MRRLSFLRQKKTFNVFYARPESHKQLHNVLFWILQRTEVFQELIKLAQINWVGNLILYFYKLQLLGWDYFSKVQAGLNVEQALIV